MDVTKKLIVNKVPLKGYMEDAYQLTVAISKECSYEWLYSNYIQLVFQNPFRYDNQPVKFYKLSWKSGQIWDADCPLLSCDTITYDLIKMNEINIIDFICKAIYKNHYVMLYLDEFYLPYKISYKKTHFIHENLFFGYDYQKRELYGLAYVTDKTGYHFKSFSVDMDLVEQSYINVPSTNSVQRSRVMLMACNWEKYYEFDMQAVKSSIYEYINSIPTDQKYISINNPNTKFVFGIGIYDQLIGYYAQSSEEKTIIPLHIIYEHKQLMLDRIKYMIENEYLICDNNLINDYAGLIKEAYLCKMLFLKYLYVNTESNYKKVVNSINSIKSHDKILMERLYQLIEKSITNRNKNYLYSHWGSRRDVAYSFDQKLNNQLEIEFELHIINEKSQGYIFFSAFENLSDYHAPMTLRIDAKKRHFIIENCGDKIVLENIRCLKGKTYIVKIKIDLEKNECLLEISMENEVSKYKGKFHKDGIAKLQYINCAVIIHENAYRYAISKLGYAN